MSFITPVGIINSLCCPHYDTTQNNGVSRADDFSNMIRRHTGESGAIAVDEYAALVIDGDFYHVVSRENHTGSVGPGGKFADNSTGKPGIWSVSVDRNTGDVRRTLVESKGKVANIIRPPEWIIEDPMVTVARAQNPDDEIPPAWLIEEQGSGLHPHHYVILVAVVGILGAIFSLYQRTRVIAQRYEQVQASNPDWDDPDDSCSV